MTTMSGWKMKGAVLLLCAVLTVLSQAQSFNTLVDFDIKNGAFPDFVNLVQGIDGNFYGTTQYGGASDSGTIFRITSAGALTRLYSFCAQPNCADGSYPNAGLVLATDGKFYGTTNTGGAYNRGTVFKVTPRGKLTTIYSFCAQPNCLDGAGSTANLVQGINENFYGTTYSGGNSGSGTIFEVTPKGRLTTLYSFCSQPNCADGSSPNAGLVLASDGNFYGTTYVGGGNCSGTGGGCGTVFKITPEGNLTNIYSFCPQNNCAAGSNPLAALMQATDGNFYGTTFSGGTYGNGTVFEITSEGTLTDLYNFNNFDGYDGAFPYAGLVQATDGNFYGATFDGGIYGGGTVFQLTTSNTLTYLYNFCTDNYDYCINGAGPLGGLLQATNGSFYGTTYAGGDLNLCSSEGCGTVFSLSIGLGPFVAFVHNPAKIGQPFGILGQGLTGTSSVELNGTPAYFAVKSDTLIEATVPSGATSGYVTVTTPTGVLTSNVPFNVIP